MAHIHDAASYKAAMNAVVAAIDGDDPRAAVAHADSATASPRCEPLLRQLRAWALTEGGSRLADRDFVVRGRHEWRALGPVADPTIAYNVANAEMALFEVDLGRHGYAQALIDHRSPLQAARTLYDAVGRNLAADLDLRVQALTNAGNAFDLFSRDLEGLRRYDEAIALDPAFGMALGNRGIALAHYARYHEHSSMLIALAARDLDAALVDANRVLKIGGPSVIAHFRLVRGQLSVRPAAPVRARRAERWTDLHARWCYERELFLHVSHHCLAPDDEYHDPLFIRGLTGGLSDEEQRRVDDLIDALNTLKQDFVAARYLTWLATAEDSPVLDEARAVSARVPFHDSFHFARWGVRTGLALQA